MATESGRAILEAFPPAPAPHAPTAPDKPRACAACGYPHGSIGVGQACLERELARLRGDLAAVARERDEQRERVVLAESEIVRLRAVVDVDHQRLREFARELAARKGGTCP